MQIFLPLTHLDDTSISSSSFVLLEVQGILELESNEKLISPSDPLSTLLLSNQVLGNISIHFESSSSTTSAILVVGHHQFHGELKKLQRPFAILHKTKQEKLPSTSFNTLFKSKPFLIPYQTNEEPSTPPPPIWECQGLVKYKFLFQSRPRHLV